MAKTINPMQNYHCPACSAPLRFDEASGQLHCDYCDSSYSMDYLSSLEEGSSLAEGEEADEAQFLGSWETTGFSEDWGSDRENLKAYNCPSCGAELICETTTAATKCPYCGNPGIIEGQFQGALRPDYVIPFRKRKEEAIEALKQHYKGKFLLPRAFRENNHLEEIQGIYVPFWLFDAQVDADCHFHATRVHHYVRGDYSVTETDHYDVHRAGRVSFSKIPADGSKKMNDDYMDSLEPFDYREMMPFTLACLPGFLADRYDVSAQECSARADQRCTKTTVDLMRMDVHGYTTVAPRSARTELHRGRVSYAFLPVWTLHTKWQDQHYLFMMNGQTGKMVGDLPMDMTKFFFTVFLSLLLGTVLTFFTGVGAYLAEFVSEDPTQGLALGISVLLGILLAAVICLFLRAQLRSVAAKKEATGYIDQGGVSITLRRDRFTHRTVMRHRRASANNGNRIGRK